MWTQPPLQKGGGAPSQFSAHVYCGQTAGWIKMPLVTKVDLSPGDSVLDGDPAPLPQKVAEPPSQFSAHIYCGQTAGCIKMSLGMEVGLSPGDSVRWRPSAPPHKGGRAPFPIFGPFLLWPNGWMHQDATWYGCRPQPRGNWVRWGPTPQREAEAGGRHPNFRPMAFVAERLYGSR